MRRAVVSMYACSVVLLATMLRWALAPLPDHASIETPQVGPLPAAHASTIPIDVSAFEKFDKARMPRTPETATASVSTVPKALSTPWRLLAVTRTHDGSLTAILMNKVTGRVQRACPGARLDGESSLLAVQSRAAIVAVDGMTAELLLDNTTRLLADQSMRQP